MCFCVEDVDVYFFDFVFLCDVELVYCFEFGGEVVGVLVEVMLYLFVVYGLVVWEEVFCVFGE